MPSLPARSVTLIWRMLLAVNACPCKLQVFCPTVVAAAVQVEPLSRDTYTVSPIVSAALIVPETVWAAVLVLKSEPELPVSALKVAESMAVVDAVVSSV